MKRTREPNAVEFIEVPDHQRPAMVVAWQRTFQIGQAHGVPPFLLEAFKPLLLSVYIQGCVDGYGAAEQAHTAEDYLTEANK